MHSLNLIQSSHQLKLFQHHKTDAEVNLKITNAKAALAVAGFQKFYRVFYNSYLTDDRKDYLKFLVGRLLELEMTYRTPLNKSIAFLVKLKKDFNEGLLEKGERKFLIFGSQTTDSVLKLRGILADLPSEISIINQHVKVHIETIRKVFAAILPIVEDEQSKVSLRSGKADKTWDELLVNMNTIIREEGHALEINPLCQKK